MTREFNLVITEGHLDAAVAKKLLQELGIMGPDPKDLRGGSNFWAGAPKYNQAARNGMVIFGVVDLENALCAPELIKRHLPKGVAPTFVLRVAKRMVESWLLADRVALAQFLHVSADRIPMDPESLVHPKHEIASLARRSRKREIRETVAPQEGLSSPVGREYTPVMKRFIEHHWNPSRARINSPSLDRAIEAILKVIRP
jgi:hypothetical protein